VKTRKAETKTEDPTRKNYELVVRLAETMEKLVSKLRNESGGLDEYQKAQVVQALVMAKQRMVQAVGGLEAERVSELEERLVKIEEEIDELVEKLDLDRVAEILTTLRLGMTKLVEKEKVPRS